MGSFLYKTRWWYAENVDPDNLLGAGFFAIMYHQNDVTPPTNPPAVSLRLSLSVNDALSGVREVVFPGLFGTGTYTATLAPYERMYTVDGVMSLESFTITASDRVGNTNGTTYTLIRDNAPPEIALTASSDSGLILPVSWAGSDDLSGVAGYDVQVRAGEGAWTDWLTGTQRTEAEFVSSEGVSYTFQVRASDLVGNNSEWTISGSSSVQGVTKYYYFGSQRVALRRGTGSGSKVYYLHGDHLGSTSLVTDGTGETVSESRYAPFGEVRWTRGASLTDFSFTGQRRDGVGLLDYNARFYSAKLGRFISADTLVPSIGSPLAWDRFTYSYGNPVKFIDPSGHVACWDENYDPSCEDPVNNPYGFKSTTTKKNLVKDKLIEVTESDGLCIGRYCSGGQNYRDWWKNEYLPVMDDNLFQSMGEIASAGEVLGFSTDAYENWRGIPLPKKYGFGIDFATQLMSDAPRTDLNTGQRFGRALVSGGEGMITSAASVFVGSQAGNGLLLASLPISVETGQLWLPPVAYWVGFSGSYLTVNYAISSVFDVVNEKLFPISGFGAHEKRLSI